VEFGDAVPTKQQYEVYEKLKQQAQPLLAQYHELMSKELPTFNEMVHNQNVPALHLPTGK
jgi:hypothetical protein